MSGYTPAGKFSLAFTAFLPSTLAASSLTSFFTAVSTRLASFFMEVSTRLASFFTDVSIRFTSDLAAVSVFVATLDTSAFACAAVVSA